MNDKNIYLKRAIGILLFFAAAISANGYDSTTIYSQSSYHNDYYDDNYYDDRYNYRENLDLQAVASLFGMSNSLEELEWKLNDPSLQISNLDLNRDGYVDYLRLVEVTRYNTHLIVIQAVIGPDMYQDVATIEVSRNNFNHTYVQIVGDPYLYGEHYIIEPTYIYTPVIYNYFWGARYYRPYYSHYRWGYYPHRYRPWRPLPTPYYSRHIHRHINSNIRYRQTRIRRSHHARELHKSVRRNDYIRYRNNFKPTHRNHSANIKNRNINSRTHYPKINNTHKKKNTNIRPYRQQRYNTGRNKYPNNGYNQNSIKHRSNSNYHNTYNNIKPKHNYQNRYGHYNQSKNSHRHPQSRQAVNRTRTKTVKHTTRTTRNGQVHKTVKSRTVHTTKRTTAPSQHRNNMR